MKPNQQTPQILQPPADVSEYSFPLVAGCSQEVTQHWRDLCLKLWMPQSLPAARQVVEEDNLAPQPSLNYRERLLGALAQRRDELEEFELFAAMLGAAHDRQAPASNVFEKKVASSLRHRAKASHGIALVMQSHPSGCHLLPRPQLQHVWNGTKSRLLVFPGCCAILETSSYQAIQHCLFWQNGQSMEALVQRLICHKIPAQTSSNYISGRCNRFHSKCRPNPAEYRPPPSVQARWSQA